MSRRGRDFPTAEYYEERERDFYQRGPRRSTREYEDLDIELSRARSHPDFLREDYGRTSAGQMVVRERREEIDIDDTRSVRSNATSRRPVRREVEKEEVIIREDDRRPRERPREREREIDREEFIVRRGDGGRPPRPRGEEREIDIEIRRDEREEPRPRMREREIERDEVDVRSVRSERPPPPRPMPMPREREIEREEFIVRRGNGERRPQRREVEKEEITIRTNEAERPRSRRPSPRREVEKEEVMIRQTTRDDDVRSVRSSRPREVEEDRETVTIRARSRGRESSLPPPRNRGDLVARETEEFVIRRRRPPSPSPSPSPPPRREVEREQIIIRERRERSPSPATFPPAPPPPEPEPEPVRLPPIIRPPIHQEIHQEIITHHRHIDHGTKHARSRPVPATYRRTGVSRARSPSPDLPLPPPHPPPENKVESTEIEIRRRYGNTRFKLTRRRSNTFASGNGRNEEEEIKIERKSRDLDRLTARSERGDDDTISRSRSMDAPRRRYYEDELEAEADYYNRRALERGYPGEGYNGATRDWAIVDVPPGTERVRMDGAGGGSQEITWQRYNGVRRSKFIAGEREFDSGYALPAPPEAVDDRRIAPRGPSGELSRTRKSDMWTEITKDLVSKEAIEYMGYSYEETEYFFYVMEYLRYVSRSPSLSW
jgi:hypothetical protein